MSNLAVDYFPRTTFWNTAGRQRILVLMPMGSDQQSSAAFMAHQHLHFPMNESMCRKRIWGKEVGEAYSTAIADALEHPQIRDWEYILTMEDDNIPHQYALLMLLGRMHEHPEFSAIGGLYYSKGRFGVPNIWGNPSLQGYFLPQKPDPNGALVECNGVSMGFTLFRLSMFKDERLRRPWFVTVKNPDGYETQDLHFWRDARKHGYRCAVDCSVAVGHIDRDGVIW